MINRREFLHFSSMGLAAAAMPELLKFSEKRHSHRLSVQLFSIREEMKRDMRGSLKRLADIGFKNVETARWPEGLGIQNAADYLKEFGLSVTSINCEIPTKDNISDILNNSETFKCKTVIWHGWPEDKRYSTLEGTKELVKIYKESYKLARDHGLHFGLHNHWWEYRNMVGGKLVYEILDEELDEDIFFDTDLYWVKVAGQDPVSIITKLKKRIQLIHIMDGPAKWQDNLPFEEPEPMSPVGQGTLNIPLIINACTDRVQWMIIEVDNSTIDIFDALKQSFDSMSKFKSVRLD